MSDDDFTIKLKGAFSDGGLYHDALDVGATLRGSLEKRPHVGDLPSLTLGGIGDPRVDFAVGPILGEGGVGVVSLARQNALKRDVAVKRFRSKDRDDRELLHEALMMGMVEHPNVVPVHLVGRDVEDGSPVIVMKHVEGVTWEEVIDDPRKAPEAEAADLDYHLRVLLQLCHAVRFAHSCGVLHLDIKPNNVMLGAFGEVYLADWGIATRVGPGGAPQPTSIRGTPAYMAPEMTTPEETTVDVRTDVFLLGATLHRVITGNRLHEAASPEEAVQQAHEFEGLELGEPVDPELAEIMAEAVARNPDERYGSVEEFQLALRQYLDHRESIALTRLAEPGVEAFAREVASGEEPDVEQLTETRFALRRALEIWPESPDALRLRRELAMEAFDWAHGNEDLKEAERALSAVAEGDRAPLEERLKALRERLRREKEELAELRSRRDQITGKRRRLTIGITVAILWGSIAGYKAWKRWDVPLEEVDPNYLPSLIPTFAIPVALVIAFRRLYATTEFNRRMLLFFGGGMVAVGLIRITGWQLELAAYVTTSMEFITYATLAFLFGTLTDLRMSAASSLLFAAAVLAIAFPHYQYGFMFVAFIFFAPYVTWLWVVAGTKE